MWYNAIVRTRIETPQRESYITRTKELWRNPRLFCIKKAKEIPVIT